MFSSFYSQIRHACSNLFTSSLLVSSMEIFSETLNYEQAPGSACFILTVSNRLLLVVQSFPPTPTYNFVYWSNSCLVAAKKNVPKCIDFICFKRVHIRGRRHEQDLISRTLSHCRSSDILLCFCRGVLRHPSTKSSTLITRLWKEESRSGENSYFWHNAATEKRAHARVSSHNWTRVFLVCVSLCVCVHGRGWGGYGCKKKKQVWKEWAVKKVRGMKVVLS